MNILKYTNKMIVKYIVSLLMMVLPICTQAQTWHKQVLTNKVTVSFPSEPEHNFIDDKGKEAYIFKSEGYALMAGIAPEVFENYTEYRNASDSERLNMAFNKLEGVVNGRITLDNQHLISMKNFTLEDNFGIDLEYATSELSNPESRKRFATILLMGNTIYMFDCWYLDSSDHDIERAQFFKSILLRK